LANTPKQRYILTPNGRNLITLLVAAQQADTEKLTALAA
jgi:DNA-binding HxlR family transcriptional regulator